MDGFAKFEGSSVVIFIGVSHEYDAQHRRLVSLIAGIFILVAPRLHNYIVALCLIIIGLLGLFGAGNLHFK